MNKTKNTDQILRFAASKEVADAVIAKLVQVASSGGFHLYLVGGTVRDKLMGIPAKDLDIVVMHPELGLQAPQALAELAKEQLGAHGGVLTNQGTIVVRIDGVEIDLAAPRAETYSEGSRKPSVQAASIEEDARRRDFTINALYEDLHNSSHKLEDRIVDPTGQGLKDLQDHILRSPNPEQTFTEDPLRMMRAVRFKAKTGFELDPETDGKLQEALPRFQESLGTQKMSWERARMELEKLLAGTEPGEAMRLMTTLGITTSIMPEWAPMVGLKHESPHHLEDVDDHSYRVLNEVAKLADGDVGLLLAGLLHDIAKPSTKTMVAEKMHHVFHNHDVEGVPLVRAILERLRFPTDIIDRVAKLVEHHLRPPRLAGDKDASDKAVRRFIRDMGDDLKAVIDLSEADIRGRDAEAPGTLERDLGHLSKFRERVKRLQEEQPAMATMKPLIDGSELQAIFQRKPGPWIGDAHKYIIDLQLGDPGITKEQAIEAVRAWLGTAEPPKAEDALVQAPPAGLEDKNSSLAPRFVMSPNDFDEGVWWVLIDIAGNRIAKSFDKENEADAAAAHVSMNQRAKVVVLTPKTIAASRLSPQKNEEVSREIEKCLARKASSKDIILGTCGFGHDEWKGRFYPVATLRKDRLSHYAKTFNAVEISSTKHSLPPTRVVEQWAASVPSGFVFAVVAPMLVTPSGIVSGGADIMRTFMRRMAALGNKLGPVVVRIRGDEAYAHGDASRFFDALPAGRYAMQVDSEEWQNQEVLGEMLKRDIVIVDDKLGTTSTDILGWGYKRISSDKVPFLRQALKDGPDTSLVFVEDKSNAFPSKELMQALRDLGIDHATAQPLSMLKNYGPTDSPHEWTGPNNSALPTGAYQHDQTMSTQEEDPDDKNHRFAPGKMGTVAPPTDWMDSLDANDGAAGPKSVVDGNTSGL